MQEAVAVAADPSQGLYLTLDLAVGWLAFARYVAGWLSFYGGPCALTDWLRPACGHV
jgi:hypothetical protein